MKSNPFAGFLHAAFWIISLAFFTRDVAAKMFDMDLWWHLQSGRVLFETKTFIRNDLFSHTMAGHPWINFEWLGQIILFGLHSGGDLTAIFILKISFSLMAIGLIGLCLHQLKTTGPVNLSFLWFAFIILRPRLLERIELFSWMALPTFVLYFLWVPHLSHSFKRVLPWCLGGLMILWVNIHGGFILGLGSAYLFLLGVWWEQDHKAGWIYLKTCLILTCAVLVNPYGIHLFRIFIEHGAQLKEGSGLISEWAPHTVQGLPFFWILFSLCAIAIVISLYKNWMRGRFWIPIVFVFAVLGTLSYRTAAILAFVGIPFLADFVQNGPLSSLKKPKGLYSAFAFPAVILIFYAVLKFPLLIRFPSGGVFAQTNIPAGAAQFVSDHRINGTLFNSYEFGGYINWRFNSKRKVFMDGRYIFFPLLQKMARLNETLFIEFNPAKWQRFLNQYGVDYAIVSYDRFKIPVKGRSYPLSPKSAQFPRPSWALVYWDDSAMVFLKRTDTHKNLIRQFEYQHMIPYNAAEFAAQSSLSPRIKNKMREELNRHKKKTGFTVIGHQLERILS